MKPSCCFFTRATLCLIALLLGPGADAQLCAGNLGDPSVNVTFGQGPGAAQPLSAATTSYTFQNADCPNDGYYAIRSTTTDCYDSWHSLIRDHTGDGNGNFMLVNASYTPGDFYVDTLKGLCSKTLYEFSAWVMNVGQRSYEIRPNILFSVEKTDGTVLQSFTTGDIYITSAPTWINYGFFFQIPAGTFDVVLRMRNNAPGGVGNDLALDDITFRACGPRISSQITGLSGTLNLCKGDSSDYTLTAQVADGFSNPIYQWQVRNGTGPWTDIPGAVTQVYLRKPTGAGDYSYRLAASESANGAILSCRVASDIIRIVVHEYPKVYAGPDEVMMLGDQLVLEGKVTGDSVTVLWAPPWGIDNVSSLKPTVNPDKDVLYTLTAKSVWGCVGADSMRLRVVNAIQIPTAFTPNSDGNNDEWRIPDLNRSKFALVKVFNRSGNLVYQARGGPVRWNGTTQGIPQPSGVFVYLVDLQNGKPPLRGTFVLIR
jgi:gliding motility-associated-like protein